MKEIKHFAPVVIPTLCRYEHFRRCVESLSLCTHAEKTDLIIGLDYPAKDEHWDGYNKINHYVDTIKGFHSVTIIRADHNLGVGEGGNLSHLGPIVYALSDRFIVAEDDNEFAPAFLDFMNKALMLYEDDFTVSSVCGYNQYVDQKRNVIFTYDHSSWGYGRWVNRIHPTKKQTYAIAKSLRSVLRIFNFYPAVLPILIDMIHRRKLYGDLSWTCSNIVNDKVQVRPAVSLVRNWGHDGSGIHCGSKNDLFVTVSLPADKTWNITDDYVERTRDIDRMVYENMLPRKRMARFRFLLRCFVISIFHCLFGREN